MNSMLSMPNMQRNWIDSLGGAFGKLAGTLVNNSNNPDDCSFFPSKPPLGRILYTWIIVMNTSLLQYFSNFFLFNNTLLI